MIIRKLPVHDATTVLAFLQTDESKNNCYFILSSLDELFNAHITNQTFTDQTHTILFRFI